MQGLLYLLAIPLDITDETELILRYNRRIERLQLHCDKVENQTKIELTNQLVAENKSISDHAMECFGSETD